MLRILPALLAVSILSAPAIVEGAAKKTMYTYDLTYTYKLNTGDPQQLRKIWDDIHFTTSLQGIVNRRNSRLYVFFVGGNNGSVDHYWLDKLRAKDEWLSDYDTKSLPDINALVKQFRRSIKGLVVYDEKVASTSNVASTVAGVESLACVRYDTDPNSLFQHLTADPDGPRLPVKVWLVNKDGSSMFTGKGTIPGSATPSTGSTKCDAYIWAKEKYLDTGKCNPKRMGYYMDQYWLKEPGGYIPNNTLTNQDYFIAQKGFIFDLSPWDDETPVDDRSQPKGTDYRTLKAILHSAYNQTHGKSMIHVGGFLPWAWKYTDYGRAGGKHGGVPGEWHYAEILSCYNAYMDADALGISGMANASFYTHYPLKTPYKQQLPTMDDLRAKGYITADGKVARKSFVTIYVGDYDSAPWLYQQIPTLWDDPARGSIPLGWGFNPNLADRFPVGMVYTRKTKSPNDVFVTGDSGAGYLNPGHLLEPRKHSGLPSGLELWKKHNAKFYKDWGVTLTGFIIEGDATVTPEKVLEAYRSFSKDGVIVQQVKEPTMYKDMPVVSMSWYLPSVDESIKLMPDAVNAKEKPNFSAFRTVLWSATEHKKLMDGVKSSKTGGDVEFVDPYTLMLLVKQQFKSGK
ncbi:MAG: GxGYxYP domain-containing protein [Armatimonadota bacterium]